MPVLPFKTAADEGRVVVRYRVASDVSEGEEASIPKFLLKCPVCGAEGVALCPGCAQPGLRGDAALLNRLARTFAENSKTKE